MTVEALYFRMATRADLPQLVAMLADDALGAQREKLTDPLPQAYHDAFAAIDSDPNNELIVAMWGERVVGMLQLTYIPSLSHQGGWRALIESVRVDSALRSQGIGRRLMEWTLIRATERGCYMAQLTTHASRADAHRFYERLGFQKTHVGMKLPLQTG